MIDADLRPQSDEPEDANSELARFEEEFGRQFIGVSARPVNPDTLVRLCRLDPKSSR